MYFDRILSSLSFALNTGNKNQNKNHQQTTKNENQNKLKITNRIK